MDGVGLTSLWVAAMRAVETERGEGALVHDPFARALAGDEGFEILERGKSTTPFDLPVIPIRTKWIDDRFARTKLDQIVILAAGMDARAFRLDSLAGKKVFEVDRDFVLAYKRERIEALGAKRRALRVGGVGGEAPDRETKPKCDRVEVPVDLRDDWPTALTHAGFDAKRPALWLVEGLLVYLEEAHVRSLFARIDRLSRSPSASDTLAPKGSELVFESNNRVLLTAPVMEQRLAFVRELGAPWLFGADDPTTLLPPTWSATVEDFAEAGIRYGRWPFPEAPKDMSKEILASIPRSFLVHATKL
jgi:O-methyltransferase involved in polyketide biosynthesis